MPSLAPGDLDTIVAEDLSYDYTPSQKFGSSEVFRIPGIMSEIETQTPRGKTLNGGRFRGVSFIQTLFVFIVGETYLRLG